MTCKTWSLPGDHHFQGLCSMEMLMETQRDMSGGCPICVSPVAPDFGLCVSCPVPPPKKYLINLRMRGSSRPGEARDYGCGAAYNAPTILHNVGNCRWESNEREAACASGTSAYASTPVGCRITPTFSGQRARIILTVSDYSDYSLGITRTQFTVQVNWQAPLGLGVGYGLLNQVILVAKASISDCWQPVEPAFYSSQLRWQPYSDMDWANPFLNLYDGGAGFNGEASLAPFGVV